MRDEMTADEFVAMQAKPRRNKYGAVRTEYNGRQYASKMQAEYAARLDMLESCGEIDWWGREIPLDLGPDTRYTVDFLVLEKGSMHAVDTKGRETETFRRNVRLWRKYGKFPLHVVHRDRTEIIEGMNRV